MLLLETLRVLHGKYWNLVVDKPLGSHVTGYLILFIDRQDYRLLIVNDQWSIVNEEPEYNAPLYQDSNE